MNNKKRILSAAVDVGTTTISAVVLDVGEGRQLEAFNLANDSTIVQSSQRHEQDPARIAEIAGSLVSSMLEKHPDISTLGFTGQMHGILYVDADGNAVSPLFTWQDGRGNMISDSGKSYCAEITDTTGIAVSTGFGLVTHYCNMRNGQYTDPSLKICSIMDYLAMRFAGKKAPVVHPSNAASFGLFDVSAGDFDRAAIAKLGISQSILPEICRDDAPIGEYRGIAVSAAIGDNQASVFGSVADEENAILVNYGTGSQVSVISGSAKADAPLEARPYLFGKNLICGCALCGGSAYAVIERFFRAYAISCGCEDTSQYKVMDMLAERAYEERKTPLAVSTLFKGTRQNPDERGGVYGIGEDNFTPEQLVLGTIHGMVNELYEMYALSGEKRSTLVASGNAVQKGRVLQSLLCDRFGMPLVIPANKEEAATGAAMYAAMCYYESLTMSDVKNCINYYKK